MYCCLWRSEDGGYLLELNLQGAVSCLFWVPRTKLWCSPRAASTQLPSHLSVLRQSLSWVLGLQWDFLSKSLPKNSSLFSRIAHMWNDNTSPSVPGLLLSMVSLRSIRRAKRHLGDNSSFLFMAEYHSHLVLMLCLLEFHKI